MGCNKTTDLYVTTPNELGILAKLTTQLKTNRINIENFAAWEEGTNACFRFVTNNNTKAREIWSKEGYKVTEEPVVLWTAPNMPGSLNNAMTALAEARVNTHFTYSSTTSGTNTSTVVIYTDNPDTANKVLSKLG
jgi:hypothetical protein